MIGILPTLVWNYQNGWISFQFHGSRQGFNLNLSNFLIMLFASFLYVLPQTILIPITKLFVIIKRKNFELNNWLDSILNKEQNYPMFDVNKYTVKIMADKTLESIK